MSHSGYYDLTAVEAGTAAGNHRQIIGGLWDEIGMLQMQFLLDQGLTPDHRLLDIGCGSLRLGARLIPYLAPRHYFGTDLSRALIDAGREHELDDAGRDRAPIEQFATNEDFDFGFLPEPVDFAMAQSVFTHLPLNHLRRCLANLAPHMRSGGVFYASYFECPPEADYFAPLSHTPGGIVTSDYCDPYHYRVDDLAWAVGGRDWDLRIIGHWNHPRDQRMAAFVRR